MTALYNWITGSGSDKPLTIHKPRQRERPQAAREAASSERPQAAREAVFLLTALSPADWSVAAGTFPGQLIN